LGEEPELEDVDVAVDDDEEDDDEDESLLPVAGLDLSAPARESVR
jgi:hypothetical protein